MSKTFLHSGARGDIVYSLPTVKALGGGIFHIKMDNKHYKSKPMDEQDVEWFRELLAGQDYIEDVRKLEQDCAVDYDLDTFREIIEDCQLLTEAHLARFNAKFDLSQPWIDASKMNVTHVADIVVNRSTRYHGVFNWGELLEWQDRCVFVGMDDEYAEFVKATGLDKIPYYGKCSYRRLAEVIAGSKLFIGNQSFPYSLAEAIKCPRVLEVCSWCPNCTPQSDNGFTRLTPGILRHFLLGEPIVRGNTMNFCVPVIGIKVRNGIKSTRPEITYIVVHAGPDLTPFSAKAHHRDKNEILWDDNAGDYRAYANSLAAKAQGRTICIVDMSLLKDYTAARKVAELLENCDGMAGMYMKQSESLLLSSSCVAVSRKTYEECGLFNLAMLPGKQNFVEMVLRYYRKKYPCRSAGTIYLPEMPDSLLYTERNEEYIRKVYGERT